MRNPKTLRDLDKGQRNAIGLFIRRLCMSKAIAQLCMYLGIDKLSLEQERECLQIMRDNFERFDANELWLDYKTAQRLQRSMIKQEMIRLTADELCKMKEKGPTQ